MHTRPWCWMLSLRFGSTNSSPSSCTIFHTAGKLCNYFITLPDIVITLLHSLRQPAYLSIVGSGVNSAILHYSANTRQVQDGDLVLVDAGGEYEGYGTDITRTFPANGKFTDQQREIYQIVLDAQQAAIAAVKPGVSFTNLTSVALHTMAQGLLKVIIPLTGFYYTCSNFLFCTGWFCARWSWRTDCQWCDARVHAARSRTLCRCWCARPWLHSGTNQWYILCPIII